MKTQGKEPIVKLKLSISLLLFVATNPTRTFRANAGKADRNHGVSFCGGFARFVRVRGRNSHFMTDKLHFMTEICLLLESITYEDDSVIK